MTMHRFYLPPEQCQSPELILSGREAHHASDVLRIQRGECVTVLDGAGNRLDCEVTAVAKTNVRLAVKQKESVTPLPYQLTLVQAIPKGKAFENILQKATELGAHRIIPLLSERTVVQIDAAEAADKVEKWKQIAIESIKQCGSPWLPQIDPPLTPKQFLARNEKFDLSLIGALDGERRHPREYLSGFVTAYQRKPRTICVWIGPEGDFTPAEMIAIKNAGVLPISLGPLVLRSDTAAIYCLSILNHELQSGHT